MTCPGIPPDSLIVDIWVVRQLALLVASALVVAVLGVIWSSVTPLPRTCRMSQVDEPRIRKTQTGCFRMRGIAVRN